LRSLARPNPSPPSAQINTKGLSKPRNTFIFLQAVEGRRKRGRGVEGRRVLEREESRTVSWPSSDPRSIQPASASTSQHTGARRTVVRDGDLAAPGLKTAATSPFERPSHADWSLHPPPALHRCSPAVATMRRHRRVCLDSRVHIIRTRTLDLENDSSFFPCQPFKSGAARAPRCSETRAS